MLENAPGLAGETSFERCAACGSVVTERLLDLRADDRRLLSYYLEQGAAVDLMAAPLVRVAGARRLLELGCGFGFALDFAHRALGLDVCGVDPGGAAAAGREMLGVSIHQEPLTASLDLGSGRFDLVLASEVLEHVPDPMSFLGVVRRWTSDEGVLRLTTPDAACVREGTAGDLLYRTLSPGHHHVLFSHVALAAVLRGAGFAHLKWESTEGTLRVWASPSPAGLARIGAGELTAPLERYLRERAAAAEPGSALELGCRYRHLKLLVQGGCFAAATESAAHLIAAMRRRHGLDLADPAAGAGGARELRADTAAAIDGWPYCLPGALYNLGMLALHGERRPSRARAHFTAAAQAADHLVAAETALGIFDGETVDLGVQARVHRVIALAHDDVAAALRELDELALDGEVSTARRAHALGRSQILLHAVHSGEREVAGRLQPRVAADLRADLVEPTTAAAACLALGVLAQQRGDLAAAREWLRVAEERARAAGNDELVAQIVRQSERSGVGVEARGKVDDPTPRRARRFAGRAGRLVRRWRRGAPSPAVLGPPRLAHMLDVYWCDATGLYLQGWVHAHERPVRSLRLRAGSSEVVLRELADRPDLLAHWPQHPHVRRAGFAAFLPTAAGKPVELVVETDDGARTVLPLELPARALPEWPDTREAELRTTARRLLRALPESGRVLAIGARQAGAAADGALPFARELSHLRRIGLDIHPGAGVDVVGDAHELGSLFAPGSFDLVLSAAVLEHLLAPWVVAAEINRVLRPGGLVFHQAPYGWPAHAEPNDFWRMSAHGLRALFGPATGFEVLDAVNLHPMAMIPQGRWRDGFLLMPSVPGFGSAEVVSRKVRELAPGEVAWPLERAGAAARARDYPVDGLAPPAAYAALHETDR